MNYEIVNSAIVVISGFTQKASCRTGMGELYCDLRRRYATTPERYIIHRAWDADMGELAHLLDRDRTQDFRLAVVAYSWGCGRGVRRFAKHLARKGIGIDLLLLIDPVIFRPILAMTRFGRFKVPPNVDAVYSWRQVNSGPFGRRLKLENDRTRILATIDHNDMDNDLRIRSMVLKRMESFVKARLEV